MREIRIDENSVSRRKRESGDARSSGHVRDLQVPSQDVGFQVNEISEDEEVEEILVEEREPGEQVKVKFDKFVQLVATHNFEEVLKNHSNEDIIMNSNLLMDLASAHEDETEDPKKQPMLIGVGVVIGVVVAYVLIQIL